MDAREAAIRVAPEKPLANAVAATPVTARFRAILIGVGRMITAATTAIADRLGGSRHGQGIAPLAAIERTEHNAQDHDHAGHATKHRHDLVHRKNWGQFNRL